MFIESNSGGGVTPTSITPSNSSPVALTLGNAYEITNNGGYAIQSYSSKTPDDSTHPSVSSGDIVKMGGAGYLYKTVQGGGKYGTITDTTGASKTVTINTGLSTVNRFAMTCNGNSSATVFSCIFFNRSKSTSTYEGYYHNGASAGNHNSSVSFGNFINAYVPTIVSISGGTVTLKTNTSTASAIMNGWWVACS